VKICNIKGCETKVLAKGLCCKHYTNYKRHGEAERQKNSKEKSVIQLSLTGLVLNIFKSAGEAAKHTNIVRQGIARVCLNGKGTAGGFKWKYDKSKDMV